MTTLISHLRRAYWMACCGAVSSLYASPILAVTVARTDRKWDGKLTPTGKTADPFAEPLELLLNLLTSNVAIAVAVVGLVMAGAVLIFQGGEMKDFIKTILSVVIVAAVLVLAGNILNFFLGATV